jgi:hypothetical protein
MVRAFEAGETAYRGGTRTPKIVLSQRMRAGTGMLALAAFAVLLGFTFATTSRLTMSCARKKTRSSELRVMSCQVTQSSAWTRSSETKVFADPRVVKVERTGANARVLVDGRALLDSTLDPLEVERMARETLLYDYGDHAIGHAGGFVLDARVLLAACGTAMLALLFSIRRHRVVVDRAEEQIRATSSVAFLPFRTQRASLRAGDRVVARVDGTRASVLLVGGRAPIVLIEDDARGECVERLAARLDALLPRVVES